MKNNLENKKLSSRKIDQLIDHYSDTFYKRIKEYNIILTDVELKEFSRKIIKDKIINLINNNELNNLTIVLAHKIYLEIKLYKSDKENLIKRYIIYCGINDKIIDYVMKKYEYLIEKNKYYNIIKKNYRNIVKKALINLNENGNISTSIKKLINNQIIDTKKIVKQRFGNFECNKEEIIKNEEFLRKNYNYLITKYYDMYKDIIKKDDLLMLITKKYNEYFNCYLKGNSNSDIVKYITTRLADYLIRLEKNNNFCIDETILKDTIINNTDVFYKVLKNYYGFYPIYNDLEKEYKICCSDYFRKIIKTDIKTYLYFRLYRYVNLLSKKYDENYLDNVINMFMNCTIIPNNLKEKYFNELKTYYIENELYKNQAFDKYLYDNISSFNYDEYLKVKKEKIKLLNK